MVEDDRVERVQIQQVRLMQTLAALALRMVMSCWAITDSTSMSMRLNSSKQHQAPDWAKPEKNRPIIYTPTSAALMPSHGTQHSSHALTRHMT